MGLFDPIWKTANPEKLEEAVLFVREVRDPKKLREIALGASFPEVQCAAAENLSDEQILREIILVDTTAFEARKAAVRRIRNERILAEIAVLRSCYPADGEAIAQITDMELLKQIAMSEQGWEQSKAVYRITDQSALVEIALHAEKGAARKTAIRCISSPDALLDLMESPAERFVKNEAFRCFDEKLKSGEAELTGPRKTRYLNVILTVVHIDDPVSLDIFHERKDLERVYLHAAREDLRAEAFYRLTAKQINSPAGLREVWKMAGRNYIRNTGKPENPWKTVLKNITTRILNSHDPRLLVACIEESGSGPDLAAAFLEELFGERFQDEAGIDLIRDEGVAAYLTNLDAYARMDPPRDMQYCLRLLAEAVPPEAGEHKWYKRFLKRVR